MAKKNADKKIHVIDLFAGPGGLAEGFSKVRKKGKSVFKVVLSVEMDKHAHQTLTLRSFLRQFDKYPENYYKFVRGEIDRDTLFSHHPGKAAAAIEEAMHATLGEPDHDRRIEERLRTLKRQHGDGRWVVIGGPPCQAYSLVGRARNKGNKEYDETKDHRHKLYEQYLKILRIIEPDLFVMENVKGLLSSKYKEQPIFERIKDDLRHPSPEANPELAYELVSASGGTMSSDGTVRDDRDFIVRAEEYGIPQSRHRVFVIGIRSDNGIDAGDWVPLKRKTRMIPVKHVIDSLPRLRSGLSKGPDKDSEDSWREAVKTMITDDLKRTLKKSEPEIAAGIPKIWNKLPTGRGGSCVETTGPTPFHDAKYMQELSKWLIDKRLKCTLNHETRAHIKADLARYFFYSTWSKVKGRDAGTDEGERIVRISPKLGDLPAALLPKHKNAAKSASKGSLFNDRFRVQDGRQPATTITSHISKDGHYFIHHDPWQVRSYTAREAARLQTFPDNYFFCGPRTQQLHQVGNAVPPLLAFKIAEKVRDFMTTPRQMIFQEV